MGVAITGLFNSKTIGFDELQNRKFAIDSYNILYQFLSTIRQHDGTPLKDSNGQITSHLVGLFSRTTNLMQKGLKLVFVFDGKVPDLKQKERERRKELKQQAQAKYEEAAAEEDTEQMKKYASRTSILTSDMVKEAKKLITGLGCPIVEAPSEGEAQAALMAKKGDVYASISQDADSLLFGAPYLVRNLTISGRKKVAGKPVYQKVEPEIIVLSENLNNLGIDREQLIALGMLVGTDFNVGGIKGIGPQKALKLVKEYKDDYDELFKHVEWGKAFDYPWTDVFYLFKNMPVKEDYELEWKSPDKDVIHELLVDEHGFDPDRVKSTLEKLKVNNSQKGLGDFF